MANLSGAMAEFWKRDGREVVKSFAAGGSYAMAAFVGTCLAVNGAERVAGVALPALSASVFLPTMPQYAPRDLATHRDSHAGVLARLEIEGGSAN